jgi:hypothetical protein
MLVEGIHFPDAAVIQQLNASREAFFGGADPLYAQLAAQTAEVAENQANSEKRALASLMPIAYFGIRAAVETVRQPDIAPHMPASVERRSSVIRAYSSFVITDALRTGAFAAHYRENDALAPLINDDPRHIVANFLSSKGTFEEQLTTLGEVAIMDASIVAGGALRFLKREQPALLRAEPAAAIVGRSVGLQLVARVPDEKLDVMREHLGSPYTNSKNFVYEWGALDFTSEARLFLNSLRQKGTGCPAHNALTQGTASEATFLRLVWSDLAEVLLPPHAKAEAPPGRRQPRSKGKKR